VRFGLVAHYGRVSDGLVGKVIFDISAGLLIRKRVGLTIDHGLASPSISNE
jgi:hypothetical protein